MSEERDKPNEPGKPPKLRRYDDLTPEEERRINHDQQNRTNEDLDADRM
jgi:hypothetical protein